MPLSTLLDDVEAFLAMMEEVTPEKVHSLNTRLAEVTHGFANATGCRLGSIH